MAWTTAHQDAGGATFVAEDHFGFIYLTSEQVTLTLTGGQPDSYEVRDYWGQVIASGPVTGMTLPLGALAPGWYKVYLNRAVPAAQPWGMAAGEVTLIVVRDPSPLHTTPPLDLATSGLKEYNWPSLRALTGQGNQRIQVRISGATGADTAMFTTSLSRAKEQVQDVLAWSPAEPNRVRDLYVSFSDYEATGGTSPTATQSAQIQQAVSELYDLGVRYFEGRNEPPVNTSALNYVPEAQAFYANVKAARPDAQVIGPCPIDIGAGGIVWLETFLSNGGRATIDALSFHVYNACNGDLEMGRRTFEPFAQLLVRHNLADKPLWMTEWGTFAAVYGSFEPRKQTQWSLMLLHLLEQYGTPRENVFWFYDKNTGFWNYPSWMWTDDSGRRCPTAMPALLRVWAEECWGKRFATRLHFGDADSLWLGSHFTTPDGGPSTVVLQSAGGVGTVRLILSGGTLPASVTVSDPLGVTTTLPVSGDRVAVPVQHLEPIYVRLPAGVSATAEPVSWGREVARIQYPTAIASSPGNGVGLLANGVLENDYNGRGGKPFMADVTDNGPAWVGITFPAPTRFDRVVLWCPPPWQSFGAPLDFDVQVQQDGQWVTVATDTEPTPHKVWTSHKSVHGCYIDSWWSRRHIFDVRLAAPVSGTAVRIYARDMSHGGACVALATTDGGLVKKTDGSNEFLGQGGPKRLTVQELAVYLSIESRPDGKPTATAPFVVTL